MFVAIKSVVIAAFIIVVTVLATHHRQQQQQETTDPQLDFLEKHWRKPVPLQGKPPAGFSKLEASLDPASCGVCHRQQFEDWQTTIHSRSIGAGLLGQLPTMLKEEPETALSCYGCHAPLAEQQDLQQVGDSFKRNPRFDRALQSHGLTCAGCHVRRHERFGPPRRDGSIEEKLPRKEVPHGGAIRTPAFERSEFCIGCHQFQEGERELNGKYLENTFNEWKSGPYSKQGVTCQQCHMPDRRHLWRGIHDKEMVQQGVSIELRTARSRYTVGDEMEAVLIVANSGVGHYFPTYITPKVVLQMEIVDANGQPIAGSLKKDAVNREATLDLSEELHDTRIPPKGTHEFRYRQPIDRTGLRLKASVTVYPDDFYRRFYEAKLEERLSRSERKLLTDALRAALQSSYKIFEKEIPLS